MARKNIEGPVALEFPPEQRPPLTQPPEEDFDWVDYKCRCPDCGTEVTGFRTKDLCNQLDTVDHRIAYHFYATCPCGAWIDFIRKTARGIEDFDMYVEQL